MSNMITRVWKRLNKEVNSFFFLDQWVILTAQNVTYDAASLTNFHSLVPPPNRYWADPFVISRDGQHYVFIEEKMYKTGLGRIACLVLARDGQLLSNQIVLERPYHLSYPFIFEYDGQMYMLPETGQNRTLELYRCTRFPDQWEFEKNLMTDLYAVDATLLEHDGKWWLFANIKEPDGSSLDKLHLFWANTPLSENWTPHPHNPIVDDIFSARPAGCIFTRDGILIRPSQDSSRRYGYALNFNCIVKLTETEYEETRLSTFKPPRGTGLLAIHTWNTVNDMTVIDAVKRRTKFFIKKLNE